MCQSLTRPWPRKARKGSMAGIDDKQQITLVLATAMTGKLLPLQFVYQGKAKAFANCGFPADIFSQLLVQ